jgi:predicted nucleotidyltransferase
MKIINNLKSILMDNDYIECKKVYLRGSYARGQYNLESDIDLLIISNDFKGISITKRKDIIQKIFLHKLENVIDCICLTEEEYNKIIMEKREILFKEIIIEVF